MAKLLLVFALVVLAFALTCTATVYTVGGTSGWDVSSDLDTWGKSNRFVVGDVLLFQYSSYNTVDEVTKESYQACNTTNVIQSSSNGNTTYTLSSPGDRYFIAGNKLYCLGGMKLHVTVEANQVAAPASAPESGDSLPTLTPTPTSKNNNPSTVSSDVAIHGGIYSILFVFLGFLVAIPWVM